MLHNNCLQCLRIEPNSWIQHSGGEFTQAFCLHCQSSLSIVVLESCSKGFQSIILGHSCKNSSSTKDDYSCKFFSVSCSPRTAASPACNKFATADLQIYACGDVIVTATEYTGIQSSRAGCKSSCSLSSVGLATSAQYYWSVSEWTDCLSACGASTQDRTVSCMNSIDGG